MLKIRAFRAIDEEDTCLRYMEGHTRVLTDYGITSISTNNTTWKDNPSVYAIIAETVEGKIVGGVRLQTTNIIEPLPVEKAVGDQDPKIAQAIYSYTLGTTGELCGLWTARQAAGWGLSLLLVRSIVAIASQVKLVSMFTLCASYTVYLTKSAGFLLEESMGNKGVFTYPVINYAAHFFRNPDIEKLSLVEETNRNRIMDLRQKPNQEVIENITKHSLEINYTLLLTSNKSVENIVLASALK